MTTTTNNKTLKAEILKLAKRRKNGVTVREAYAYISTHFVNADGSDVLYSSVRARTYELENTALVFSGERRNNAMVFVPA